MRYDSHGGNERETNSLLQRKSKQTSACRVDPNSKPGLEVTVGIT